MKDNNIALYAQCNIIFYKKFYDILSKYYDLITMRIECCIGL